VLLAPRADPALSRRAAIDAKSVKALRDATGAGMMACKNALVEFDGDIAAATEELRKKGLASADKKASRATKEGIIETYIHTGELLPGQFTFAPTRWRVRSQMIRLSVPSHENSSARVVLEAIR